MFVRGVVKVHHICWHSRWRWRDSPSPDLGGGREVHLSMDSQRVCVYISPVPVKQWSLEEQWVKITTQYTLMKWAGINYHN